MPAPGAATATDACGDPTITSALGEITSNGCQRSQTRTYTATDGCGNSSTCQQVFTWTVVTTPVLAGVPAGGALGCNPTTLPSCDPNVSASNECGTVEVTCTPGTIQENGCNRTQIFTYSATACGLTSSATATYTWTVVTAPVLAGVPAGGALGCNPTTLPVCSQTVTASNECGSVTVTCTPGTIQENGCNRTQIFTYSATACGLTSSATATYTWKVDTEAPVLTCPQNITRGQCNNTVTFTATATDNCEGTPTIVYSHQPGSVFPVGTTTVTVTATDACGNSATCTFTVTIVPRPTCNLTAPNPLPNCGSTGNILTAGVTGSGLTYAWSVSGAGWAITGGQSSPSITYTAGSTGTLGVFSLTVTDQYGCTSTNCTVTFGCIASQGCSPGFWKNHPELWDQLTDPVVVNMPSTLKFRTTTNFFTYFGITPGTCGLPSGSLTMLQALDLNGGDCNAFTRHAVASLLTSASGLNMPYPTGTTDFTSLYNAIKLALQTCNCSGTLFSQLVAISRLDGPWCSALQNLLIAEPPTSKVSMQEPEVKAYPNPFTDKIVFTINPLVSGYGSFELYDLLGVKVATLYEGNLEKGLSKTIIYRVPIQNKRTLYYRFRVGKEIVTGKVIYMN